MNLNQKMYKFFLSKKNVKKIKPCRKRIKSVLVHKAMHNSEDYHQSDQPLNPSTSLDPGYSSLACFSLVPASLQNLL